MTAVEPADVEGAEQAAIRSIVVQLLAEFPTEAAEAVRSLVISCYLQTAGARVQNFRFVLAERAARAVLARSVSS